MKTFLLASVAAAAALAVAPALAQTASAPTAAQHHGRFAQTESRAEVQSRVQQHFAKLDANRDGFITQAETDALKAQRVEKRKYRAEKRAQRFDPAKMFGRMDANKDGKITQAEADAAHSAHMARRDGKPAEAHATAMGGLFAKADINKDGVITRAEFDAAPHPRHDMMMKHAGLEHGRGGHMFGMADLNKDGKVSLAEAQQAALHRFDRIDLNHDGKITPEERKQARDQFRAQRRPG